MCVTDSQSHPDQPATWTQQNAKDSERGFVNTSEAKTQ